MEPYTCRTSVIFSTSDSNIRLVNSPIMIELVLVLEMLLYLGQVVPFFFESVRNRDDRAFRVQTVLPFPTGSFPAHSFPSAASTDYMNPESPLSLTSMVSFSLLVPS